MDNHQALRRYRLTERELEITDCVLEGLHTAEIAARLQIKAETVKRHIYNVFEKTGMGTRVELATFVLTRRIEALEALISKEAR